MKTLHGSNLCIAGLRKSALLAASTGTFALISAGAALSCSIPIHNQSGVTLTVNVKNLDSNDGVVSESNVELSDGQIFPLQTDQANAVIQLNVMENGQSLGIVNLDSDVIASCQLDNHHNQPICKNKPQDGEITLVKNGVNCF